MIRLGIWTNKKPKKKTMQMKKKLPGKALILGTMSTDTQMPVEDAVKVVRTPGKA